MQWLEGFLRGATAANGAGHDIQGPEVPLTRPEHWADEALGIDGAPAMAFTDTMPGYIRAIDLPSTAP